MDILMNSLRYLNKKYYKGQVNLFIIHGKFRTPYVYYPTFSSYRVRERKYTVVMEGFKAFDKSGNELFTQIEGLAKWFEEVGGLPLRCAFHCITP